jgi:hypothetical protein
VSTYKEMKKDFLVDLACSGGTAWRFGKYLELGNAVIPDKLLDKWVAKFYKQTPPQLHDKPRLVNHFKLGADPEFVFMTEGKVAHASELGLKAGLAVGADNNGRLAELRPKPSKFALKVVASMYAEFCFLAQWNPALTRYTWFAQPFVGKDGLGGHIHFGRWHSPRAKEVEALDVVMHLLTGAGCINTASQRDRLATKLYGRFGDVRAQGHGYEYRTFPTWVGCPRHAHLYLTLSKLAVFDPKMFNWLKWKDAVQAQQLIDNILAFYQNVDDDAKIARYYLKHCFAPPHGDIQKAWGITPLFKNVGNNETDILPPFIAPKESHIKIMFDYLTTGNRALAKDTFEPLRFPEGYFPFQRVLITDRRPELGELVWDMARVPMKYEVGNIGAHQPPDSSLRVSQLLYSMIKSKLNGGTFKTSDGSICKVTQTTGMATIDISFPHWLLDKQYRKWLRKFLTEEDVFPFVKLGQPYTPRSWKVRESEQLLLRA